MRKRQLKRLLAKTLQNKTMDFLPQKVETEGFITSTHGYKGNIHIQWEVKPTSLKKGDYLFVLIHEKGVPFIIEEVIGNQDILKLAFINSDKDAQEIIGLPVSTGTAPIPSKNEDLFPMNYTLIDTNSEFQGIITAVEEYPQQTIWTVTSENREYLIPFVEDWIEMSEPKTRTLKVHLPAGLLNLDESELED